MPEKKDESIFRSIFLCIWRNIILAWGALFIVLSLIGFFLGKTGNFFLLAGVILVGVWAVKYLNHYLGKTADTGKNIFWYLAITGSTILFALSFFPRTLLYMYGNWRALGNDVPAFILIFAPVIGLVIVIIALTMMSKDTLKWSKRWAIFCLIMFIPGILLTPYRDPFDRWLQQRMLQYVDSLDASSLEMEGKRGVWAKPKGKLHFYQRDLKSNYVFAEYDPNNTDFSDLIKLSAGAEKTKIMDINGERYLPVFVGWEKDQNLFIKASEILSFIPSHKFVESDGYNKILEGDTMTVELLTDAPVEILPEWDCEVTPYFHYKGIDEFPPMVSVGKGGFFEMYNAKSIGPVLNHHFIVQWKGGGVIKFKIKKIKK